MSPTSSLTFVLREFPGRGVGRGTQVEPRGLPEVKRGIVRVQGDQRGQSAQGQVLERREPYGDRAVEICGGVLAV